MEIKLIVVSLLSLLFVILLVGFILEQQLRQIKDEIKKLKL